jgi:ribulose-phosphate 3-epimerase
MIKVVASLMCGDWLNLSEDIHKLEAAGVDGFHLDVMDGVFVPNFSMNFWMLDQVRSKTKLPLDVHLMANEPIRFIKRLADTGVETITLHAESTNYLDNAITEIKDYGAKAGIALNPETSVYSLRSRIEDNFDNLDLFLFMTSRPGFMGQKFRGEVVNKIKEAREILKKMGKSPEIMADGGVGPDTIPLLADAGVNVFVGGTSGLFIKGTEYSKNVENIKKLANASYKW